MAPFTIRIFVPDGDPESIRVIDKMNWTGRAVVFPRGELPAACTREELNTNGVYILVGRDTADGDDFGDLPRLYIGQTDDLKQRLFQHDKERDFWDWGLVFVSTNNGLNRGHITWLEHALIGRAESLKQCTLDNSTMPNEPPLTEFDRADMQVFLGEMLQILPLVGLNALEQPKKVEPPRITNNTEPDTVIVPAKDDGFRRVFLGENQWHAIRISGGMLKKIKYIAAYQTRPVSAITHWAEVDHIVPHGDTGKYRLMFKGPAKSFDQPIPFADAPSGAMQGPRYTKFEKLKAAKSVGDVV
ncbi:hypothetical protein JM93_03873 [Roseibium hamelinense]|uniref:GIY-YIG domain-containing protein n=1 Tax=Roseibium hamelinense TaxID=150831 RepID=A0A562SKS1_9HYPH|nr:GIY-YIG nuclease family protein [Roseibium hamelinense]MTI43450.1 GIY-YIG nuclease family protein [Roseibium hamelinense]TWI81911.1 hypothetical protein JM93_03873 [Roseibium hamelinense]